MTRPIALAGALLMLLAPCTTSARTARPASGGTNDQLPEKTLEVPEPSFAVALEDSCKFSRSIRLNGANDYVQLPNAALNNLSQGTVELWVKFADLSSPSATPGQQWILTRCWYAGGYYRNDFTIGKMESGPVHRYVVSLGEGGPRLFSSTPVVLNVWTHLAVSWDGQYMRLYVNGVGGDSLATTNSLSDAPTHSVRLGMIWAQPDRPNEEAHFNGTLDELRVSTVARQPSEFCLLNPYAPDAGSLSLWHFDELDGDTIHDVSPNSFVGSLVGGRRVICCACIHQGDIAVRPLGNGVIDVFDVIEIIGIAFSGLPDIQDPLCPRTRADVDNNGVTDVFDVIYLINHAFSGGPPPVDPCTLDPCTL